MVMSEWSKRQIEARPIEATLVRKIVRALKAAGDPVVSVDDGEEDTRVSTEWEVLDLVFNLDEARLWTDSGSWVYLVMGEEYESMPDYSAYLEDALKPVNDWIDKNLY